MKLVIAAVMYSPNLGDGLIAQCLSARISALRPQGHIEWLDIAGRSGFARPATGLRTMALETLTRLPRPVSDRLAARMVRRQIRTRLDPLIPAAFQDADAVIVGGGQLLADANLNFPLKLARIAEAALAYDLPLAIHCVGVSADWSPRGLAMFKRLLLSPGLVFVSVRDAASAENLARHYRALGAAVPKIEICPDPALLAGGLDLPARGPEPQGRIGIGIMHPAAIRTHAADRNAPGNGRGLKAMLAQYRALIETLQKHGADITLFTNGSGEDEHMLGVLWDSLPSARNIARLPRPRTPLDLAAAIRDMRALASFRLHACIAAHALGTHAVGFRWDRKIDAYFALIGQEEALFDFTDRPERVAGALLSGPSETLRPRLSELAAQAGDGTAALLGALEARPGGVTR